MWSRLDDVRTRAYVFLAGGLLIVLAIQVLQRAYSPGGYDFTSYLLSAQALLQGTNPYKTASPHPYIYPLFLAFLLTPLTLLPYWLANILWFALSVTALVLGCRLLLGMAEHECHTVAGKHLALPTLVLLVIFFSPVQHNLLNGQVNLLVILCCVLFLHNWTGNRPIAATAWLGAAIALKLLPVVLLVFLLLRRQYRLLCYAVVFALLFCFLPVVFVGKNIFAYYDSYLRSFVFQVVRYPGGSIGHGQFFYSLQGAIEYILPATASRPWVAIASRFVMLAAILAVDMAALRHGNSRQHTHVWAFCAYLLGCALFSPMPYVHHMTYAIPAVFLIGLKTWFDRQWTTGVVPWLAGLFVLCFDILPIVQRTGPWYFAAFAILLLLLFMANRTRDAFPSPSPIPNPHPQSPSPIPNP